MLTSESPARPPAPDRESWLSPLPALVAWLPAAVVLTSWLDWAPGTGGIVGRAGPYWAGLVFCSALTLALAYAPTRSWLRAAARARELRAFALAAALVVIGWTLAAASASDRRAALLGAARVLLTLLFFAATYLLARRSSGVRSALAWVALGLIVAQTVLLVGGLTSARFGRLVFEQARVGHIQLGALPRFRGLMLHPMACGSATLLLAGLVAGLPQKRLRLAAIAAALAVTAATLSFATLLVPLAVALVLPVRRALRATVAVLVATGAIATLWITPLRLDIAGRTVLSRPLPASYHLRDLGPKYMPVYTVGSGAWKAEFFWTGYALLAARSLTCAAEHPLGVGARNFEHRCPVMAMNTLGVWADHRSAHNSYGALLAEGGVLTTVATALMVLLLARLFGRRANSRIECAIIVVHLFAGFAGASPYQFPFAALVAISIEPNQGTTATRRSAPARHVPS